ncbi:hypothetical protein AKJ57_05605, partial [candidate division MSBL1 archaeon SCGC-AAA259A05]
ESKDIQAFSGGVDESKTLYKWTKKLSTRVIKKLFLAFVCRSARRIGRKPGNFGVLADFSLVLSSLIFIKLFKVGS